MKTQVSKHLPKRAVQVVTRLQKKSNLFRNYKFFVFSRNCFRKIFPPWIRLSFEIYKNVFKKQVKVSEYEYCSLPLITLLETLLFRIDNIGWTNTVNLLCQRSVNLIKIRQIKPCPASIVFSECNFGSRAHGKSTSFIKVEMQWMSGWHISEVEASAVPLVCPFSDCIR